MDGRLEETGPHAEEQELRSAIFCYILHRFSGYIFFQMEKMLKKNVPFKAFLDEKAMGMPAPLAIPAIFLDPKLQSDGEREIGMNSNLIKAQKPDYVIHLDEVSVPDYQKNEVSRLRETGHVRYRCTRSYKTTGSKKRDEK